MEEITIWISKKIYSVLLSTQQNHDETLVNLKIIKYKQARVHNSNSKITQIN